MTRSRGRRDANHTELVRFAERLGFSVSCVADLPGELDLIVGLYGIDLRVEIKDGTLPRSRRTLTEDEEKLFREWKGRPPVIWKSPADVMETRDALLAESQEEATVRRK